MTKFSSNGATDMYCIVNKFMKRYSDYGHNFDSFNQKFDYMTSQINEILLTQMDKLDLPQLNRQIADYWKHNDTFAKSMKKSEKENRPPFIFYDGPPFATGSPHYGHLLASTLKDIVPRYKSQMGFHVERKWGWDTHGLPIEYEIEKDLGIKTKQQILDYTIPLYNEKCRSIVLKYADEWEKMVHILGRWVDYKNNWKTMDTNYMESVWWIFKNLFDKGLIYRGFKVMPYSTGCHTPLSNFEAQSNYKQVNDYSLTVKFQLTEQSVHKIKSDIDSIDILVWTTTPWTLPANLAICLSSKLKYALIVSDNQYYILSHGCIKRYFDESKYQLIQDIDNETLSGLTYKPLYNHYEKDYPSAFILLFDDYVTDDKGTGCVHQAPAFGNDDYRVCAENHLIKKGEQPPCPVNSDGCFIEPVNEYKGIYIKTAEPLIVSELKKLDRIHKSCKELHEYPHCWRSETPLIYMTVPSWFMEVEKMSPQLVELNKQIKWSPDAIGTNRFGNWLTTAQDWCLSRNRYWGTPMPIWTNGEETIVVGSIAELEALAGLPLGTINDLHSHNIDHITLPSPSGKQPLRRIEEVFDCWFESGCMPYAHIHYMGDSQEQLASHFPADFIAEGLDQTRGWFYTLHVISTALFNSPAFKNVIVNGLILAEDGKKMAKKLKNYPPTDKIFDTYGADALRLYLINSDVVQAEPMKFVEKDIRRLVQIFFIPFHHSVSFLVEMTKYYHQKNDKAFKCQSDFKNMNLDKLDNLMLMYVNETIHYIHSDMDKYQLNKIVGRFISLIDKISRMYIKLKKVDIKNITTDQAYKSLNVLYYSLYTMTLMLSPFAPFVTEYYYQQFFKSFTGSEESVHFLQLPKNLADIVDVDIESLKNAELIESSDYFMTLLDLGHAMREKLPFSYKRPLKSLTIINGNEKIQRLIQIYHEYFLAELNLLDLQYNIDDTPYIKWGVSIDFRKLAMGGYKDLSKLLTAHIKDEHNQKHIHDSLTNYGYYEFNGVQLPPEYFLVEKKPKDDKSSNIFIANDFIMIPDLDFDTEIEYLFELRQLTRLLNDYRKMCGWTIMDYVTGTYKLSQPIVMWDRLKEDIRQKTKINLYDPQNDFDGGETFDCFDTKFTIKIDNCM